MIYISDRGNLQGPNLDKENHPDYLLEAIKQGFQVKLDVRFLDGKFILGHDFPQYEVSKHFLSNKKFWVHAETIATLHMLMDKGNFTHCFFHDKDDCTITSQGWIWTYPGKPIISQRSIAVLPENIHYPYDIKAAGGICTNFPLKYKTQVSI